MTSTCSFGGRSLISLITVAAVMVADYSTSTQRSRTDAESTDSGCRPDRGGAYPGEALIPTLRLKRLDQAQAVGRLRHHRRARISRRRTSGVDSKPVADRR